MAVETLATKLKTGQAEEILKTGSKILWTEAKAIEEFSKILDQSFVDAVELIANNAGRVIVTGMGKSGHIARKIAATMASTGTPAFFVHPGEASHGDMGMIVRGDVVIAISNSGESKELLDMIDYTRRFAIPMIGITSKADSTLGSRSDIPLLLPPFPEACPNGLAPTTSTTLTLALGDALAVSLLEQKSFTAKDFSIYHPGGKLGQQLLCVTDIMHTGAAMPVLSQDVSTSDAFAEMGEKSLGCVGLVDEKGVLAGIITDGDIRRHVSPDLLDKKASDIMTTTPMTITEETLVGEAMGIMNDVENKNRKITCLFVLDGENRPVGLLHLHDCLKAGFS